MTAITHDTARTLLERLPPVRGDITPLAPMATGSWLGVGGPAEVLFKPRDEDDLRDFLAACPGDVPVTIIGATSNLLIRDGGIPGVVIRLGPSFAAIQVDGETIRAGGGANVSLIARRALEAGLTGFEFLAGIPGTLGGGVRMNAGAHGASVGDILDTITVMDRSGQTATIAAERLTFGYRHTDLPENAIVLAAVLRGRPALRAEIEERMAAYKVHRQAFQPERVRTAGSTFANPPRGPRAWELIDQAGCRGLSIGGARMNEKHCNFMINTGTATAADLEALGEAVRQRVREASGIDLRWEICRIGVPLPGDGQ